MSIDEVLGMNRRNIDYIMNFNKRKDFVLVDDKLVTKELLDKNGIPNAKVIAVCDSFFGIDDFLKSINKNPRFALKPSKGSGGSGIVVVSNCREGAWHFSSGEVWKKERQREHVESILYGTFSLDSTGDTAFAENLIETHRDLLYFTDLGLPDVRVILFQGEPICSMLRVPTRRSQGKANLHAGGFAVGIDLLTGITQDGWYRNKPSINHPETNVPLSGRAIPFWKDILDICSHLYGLFPLGYMGVDFAIDAALGPLILELNARPGLEIQNVTKQGIRVLLERKLT